MAECIGQMSGFPGFSTLERTPISHISVINISVINIAMVLYFIIWVEKEMIIKCNVRSSADRSVFNMICVRSVIGKLIFTHLALVDYGTRITYNSNINHLVNTMYHFLYPWHVASVLLHGILIDYFGTRQKLCHFFQ